MNFFHQIKPNHFLYSTALLLAVLPIANLVVPVLVLILISWLMNEPFSEKLNNLKTRRFALLFALPFFAYLLGMLNSANLDFGWRDIELKLSLLIFPMIYGSTSFPLYQYRKPLVLTFIYSSAISGLLSIIYGAVTFHQIPTYSMMDLFLHPSYLAMYLNLAFGFILLVFLNRTFQVNNGLLLIASIIISGSILLSMSKSGIILWILMTFTAFLYNVFWLKKYMLISYTLLALGIGLGVISYHKLPGLKERITYAISSLETDVEELDGSVTESSRVRLMIWNQTVELIKENPLLGTGTGDIKDELFMKYREAGMTGALEKRLNVHNQFLQVFATLGFFGFLAFLMAFVLPFIVALKRGNNFYLAVVLVFGINIMFESMLERQDGVVFYAFLNALLFFHFSPKRPQEKLGRQQRTKHAFEP